MQRNPQKYIRYENNLIEPIEASKIGNSNHNVVVCVQESLVGYFITKPDVWNRYICVCSESPIDIEKGETEGSTILIDKSAFHLDIQFISGCKQYENLNFWYLGVDEQWSVCNINGRAWSYAVIEGNKDNSKRYVIINLHGVHPLSEFDKQYRGKSFGPHQAELFQQWLNSICTITQLSKGSGSYSVTMNLTNDKKQYDSITDIIVAGDFNDEVRNIMSNNQIKTTWDVKYSKDGSIESGIPLSRLKSKTGEVIEDDANAALLCEGLKVLVDKAGNGVFVDATLEKDTTYANMYNPTKKSVTETNNYILRLADDDHDMSTSDYRGCIRTAMANQSEVDMSLFSLLSLDVKKHDTLERIPSIFPTNGHLAKDKETRAAVDMIWHIKCADDKYDTTGDDKEFQDYDNRMVSASSTLPVSSYIDKSLNFNNLYNPPCNSKKMKNLCMNDLISNATRWNELKTHLRTSFDV